MMDNEAPEGERELVSGLGNQGETNVRDSWGLTYAVFFVLGTSCLFPWNVLITETDYFNKRFHVAPYVPLVADNFENCLAVAFQLPNLLALWAFVHFNLQHRMPPVVQVLMPLATSLVLLGVQAALTQHLGMSGNAMVGVTLPSACLLGVMTSVLNGGCFGLVSALPPVYAQATMTGQALAGFAVACASFVTIWAEGAGEDSLPEMQSGAFHYFLSALGDILLGICGYCILLHLPFYKHHQECQHAAEQDQADEVDKADERGLAEPLLGGDSSGPPPLPHRPRRAGSARCFHAAVLFNFMVTLTLFPGITSMIASVQPLKANRLTTDLWIPCSYLLFNAGDVGGRVLAGWWPRVRPNPAAVLAGSAARILLVPAVLLCNVVPPGDKTWTLPVVFNHDVFPQAFILIMGLTGGYIGAVCMMHAPTFVEPAFRKSEGAKMSLSLITGCTSGCFLSLVALAVADASKQPITPHV